MGESSVSAPDQNFTATTQATDLAKSAALTQPASNEPNITDQELIKKQENALKESVEEGVQGAILQSIGCLDTNQASKWWWNKKSSSSSMSKLYSHEEGSLVVDISPIFKILDDKLKTLVTQSTSWFSGRSQGVNPLITVQIPSNVIEKGKIPEFREVIKTSKPRINKKNTFPKSVEKQRFQEKLLMLITYKLKKNYPEVMPLLKSIDDCVKEYKEREAPESRYVEEKKRFQRELLSLRTQPISASTPAAKNVTELLDQENIVHTLFDLPRSFANTPDITANGLASRVETFFKGYIGLMSAYQASLESEVRRYLDPSRQNIAFYKNGRKALYEAFLSCNDYELLCKTFPIMKSLGGFETTLKEKVSLLSMVDGLVDKSFKKGNVLNSLFPMVKDVLFFKAMCEAIIQGKPVPSNDDFDMITGQHLNKIFKKDENTQKAKAAIDRVSSLNDKTSSSSTLSTSRQSSSDQTSDSDKTMSEDNVLLRGFFTNLIKDELRSCLAPFGLPKEPLKKE